MLITCPQSELCVFKVIKLDVQIRPVFADPVTYFSEAIHFHDDPYYYVLPYLLIQLLCHVNARCLQAPVKA